MNDNFNYLKPIFQDMLAELKSNKLIVNKIWADGKPPVREVENKNPKWYSEMCSLYPRTMDKGRKVRFRNKPRTIIKRKDTIIILQTLIKKGESVSKYAYHIIEEAEKRKKELDNLSQEGYEEFLCAMEHPL